MARALTERTEAVADSASTWQGVDWTAGERGGSRLRLSDRLFGRLDGDRVEVAFPGRLSDAVVRHDLADAHEGTEWVSLRIDDESRVHDATALLWLAYLSHVSRIRREQPDAYPSVDVDAGLAELRLSPGVIHLVREQARGE